MGERYKIDLDMPDPLDGPVLNRPCYLPWRFLFIDTDGTARFCYQAWEQPIGNLLEVDDLDSLWNNEAYQKIRATVNSGDPYFPYCDVCHIRRGAALETSHFHKTDESADLFSFEPVQDQHKRNAGIIHLTPMPATNGADASNPVILLSEGKQASLANKRHEMKRQSRSTVIGEWECEECGHITGGTVDVTPYSVCPECAAPASKSRFAAYASQTYDQAYQDGH
jgi:hypothetical protein